MARIVAERPILAVISAVLLSSSVMASAQPAVGPGRGPMGGGGPGMMGGSCPGATGGCLEGSTYLEGLKAQLHITASQEPAWKQYADTFSAANDRMQGLHQTMWASMGTATWDERRTMMDQMLDAREQAYNTVHEAAEKLLATLDPVQKRRAYAILPGVGGHRGMMGRR